MAEVKEMEKLPEGWRRVSIEKDTILTSGIRPQGGAVDEGIPSLGGEHITPDGRLNFSDENAKYIPEKFFRLMTKGKVEKDDILINKDGANTGKVAILKEKFYPDIAINEHLFVLRSKEFFDQKYLFYWILSHLGQKQIKDRITGSAQPGLSSSFTKNFFVLKPPLPEQRKIAEILETVDNAIEKTDAIIEKYKCIKQGLMQDLLTRGIDENGQIRSEETHRFKDSPIGRIPEEWEVVELGEVCKVQGGFAFKSEEFSEDGIPIIKITNINNENVKLEKNNSYLSYDKLKHYKSFILKEGDILIALSEATVGKIGRIKDIKLSLLNQRVAKFTVYTDVISNEFLFYSLLKGDLFNFIINNAASSAQPNISPYFIENFQIPLPPLPEQHRIASILSQIDEAIEKEQKYKEKLERIKRGLMEDLLTGKVRVNHLIEEGERNEN